MAKKVEYEGIKYKIGFKEYGSSTSVFTVNGESSSLVILNCNIRKLYDYKKGATDAILEFNERHKVHNEFKQWDGKI